MTMMLNNSSSEFHFLFKVVLVGNSGVGKSSIVIRYADDEFTEVFLATIGVDFRFKSFPLEGNKVKLQIWDTAGHQRFRTITSSYYRGAHALMIVFDITNRESFQDAISYWYKQIRNSCPLETQILLIGNKSDLQEKRCVTVQQIQKFVEQNPQVGYIETSAKTSQKIQQAFKKIAEMLIKQEAKKMNRKKQITKKKKKQSQTQQNGVTKLQSSEDNHKSTRRVCCNN